MALNDQLNAVSIGDAAKITETIIANAFKHDIIPQNVMLHGSPGLGKSAIIAMVTNNLQQRFSRPTELIDLRLSAMEASDVQGIPYNAKTGRVVDVTTWDADGNAQVTEVDEQDMYFSTPAWWPRDPSKNYVLFLDELTNCPIHVQHAAYRLILDRSIQNQAKLPNNVAIVAAGNLKSDKTGARDLAPAAANRFGCHLFIDSEAATESFLDYAVNANFHPAIIGFLSWKGQNVYSDATERTSSPAWASPRSWEFVDSHMKNEDFTDTQRRVAISGAIGSSKAHELAGFLEYQSVLPDWKKVRSGEIEYKIPSEEDQVKFTVTTALAFEVRDGITKHKAGDDSQEKQLEHLAKILDQVADEHIVLFFKTLTRDIQIATETLNYSFFREKFMTVSEQLRKTK